MQCDEVRQGIPRKPLKILKNRMCARLSFNIKTTTILLQVDVPQTVKDAQAFRERHAVDIERQLTRHSIARPRCYDALALVRLLRITWQAHIDVSPKLLKRVTVFSRTCSKKICVCYC